MIDSSAIDLESVVSAFERAWHTGVPEIAEFAAGQSAQVLAELVQIDLEFRWKTSTDRVRGRVLESYVKRLPQLGTLADLPLELIAQEYRVRMCWGDQPPHADYLARFPQREGLQRTLIEVDEDLYVDGWTFERQQLEPARVRLRDVSHTDYRFRRLLASGGVALVYAGVDLKRQQPVAIKVLNPKFHADRAAVGRFRQEAEVVQFLNLPGVVGVQGLGRLPNGGHFMVLDLVGGGDLAAFIESHPLRASLWLIAQVAHTVGAVHQAGVVHCDLKPTNILMTSEQQALLADFGFAQGRSSPTSNAGGTWAYMAPEQLNHTLGCVGPWTDVWGLGGLLHFAICGRAPRTDDALIPRLDSLDQVHADASVVQIARDCLSGNALDRPTAMEVARRLSTVC